MAKRSQRLSLIEITIVLAVIAILISLLLPALKNSISKAQAIACNMKVGNLSKVIHLYADDFITYPVTYGAGSLTRIVTLNQTGSFYFFAEYHGYQVNHSNIYTEGFYKFSSVNGPMRCDATPINPAYTNDSFHAPGSAHTHFGMNGYLSCQVSSWGTQDKRELYLQGRPITQVESPDATVAIRDSWYPSMGYDPGGIFRHTPAFLNANITLSTAYPHHDLSASFGYLDGHVENETFQEHDEANRKFKKKWKVTFSSTPF